MPAHVLAHGQQFAVGAEQAGGVQPAGAREDPLRAAKPARQRGQDGGRDPHLVGRQVSIRPNGQVLDTRLAADAARAGGEEAATQSWRGAQIRPEAYVGDVPCTIVRGMTAAIGTADLDPRDVPRRSDHALADQEASRQVDVVTWRAHRQRDGLTADPDPQRLLSGQQVGPHRHLIRQRHPQHSPSCRPPGQDPALGVDTRLASPYGGGRPAARASRSAALAAGGTPLLGWGRGRACLDHELARLPAADRT